MKIKQTSPFLLFFSLLLNGCTNPASEPSSPNTEVNNTIEFLAFGDGGYHMDYPKTKHIKHPKTPEEWLKAEKDDWIAEHRPADEFNHAPIYVYPNTSITAELSGAGAVGEAMANYCLSHRCDFLMQLGDNIYPNGADYHDGKDDQQRMDDLIAKPLTPLLKNKPNLKIYSSLGNHDWKSSRLGIKKQIEWMKDHPNFTLEDPGYYKFTKGRPGQDVEFFILDTNVLLAGQKLYEVPLNSDGSEIPDDIALAKSLGEWDHPDEHEKPINNEDKNQLAWLEKSLAESSAHWKVVIGHHVLWSVGGTKYTEARALRKLLMPSLCQYADAYIAGHEHDLEMLTDDCSKYLSKDSTKSQLPIVISGSASKMRGIHSTFAKQQALHNPEMDLIWAKGFAWGFAQITLDNIDNEIDVTFYSTPTDRSGDLVREQTFSFKHRSSH